MRSFGENSEVEFRSLPDVPVNAWERARPPRAAPHAAVVAPVDGPTHRPHRRATAPLTRSDVPIARRRTAHYRERVSDHPQPDLFVANNLGVDGAWVIELDDRIVGSVFLGEELACLLDPAVHRRGIATEAAAAVITDGFERRRYTRIIARANSKNVASLRAIAKLGFVAAGDGSYTLDRVGWARGNRPG